MIIFKYKIIFLPSFSINQTYIFINTTYIYINTIFVFINTSYIYRFSGHENNFISA